MRKKFILMNLFGDWTPMAAGGPSESDAGGGEGEPWGLDGARVTQRGGEEGGGFLERRVGEEEWRKSTEI